jgi:hypothetical protein
VRKILWLALGRLGATSQERRPLENATASSTARMAAIKSTGRKIRPKSRNNRAQSFTAVTKLHSASPPSQASVSVTENRARPGGAYLLARRTRALSISYTPIRSASFSTLITGPSSGNTHGHPLVSGSGSVAARKTAPAMRGMGVNGMPASMSLIGSSRSEVSFHEIEIEIIAHRTVNAPANQGWMTAIRMLSASVLGSSARMRPSTPCFEAVYCGANETPCQDAAPDRPVCVSGAIETLNSSTYLQSPS